MSRGLNPAIRDSWTPAARRMGMASAIGLLVIGLWYVATIAVWLVLVRAPRQPISDPFLAIMELLTLVSAPALVGMLVATHAYSARPQQVFALAGLCFGALAAGITMTVHFLELTAIRQLAQADEGRLGYLLVWPSSLLAADYLAWDLLVGLSLVCASRVFVGDISLSRARRVMALCGVMCLVGSVGPLSGAIAWQNIAVLGYAAVLPFAAGLIARAFRATAPATAVAEQAC
jgi:hypothetical protein